MPNGKAEEWLDDRDHDNEVREKIARLQAENAHLRATVAGLTRFRDALLEITQAELARRGDELERLQPK